MMVIFTKADFQIVRINEFIGPNAQSVPAGLDFRQNATATNEYKFTIEGFLPPPSLNDPRDGSTAYLIINTYDCQDFRHKILINNIELKNLDVESEPAIPHHGGVQLGIGPGQVRVLDKWQSWMFVIFRATEILNDKGKGEVNTIKIVRTLDPIDTEGEVNDPPNAPGVMKGEEHGIGISTVIIHWREISNIA